MPGPGPAGPRRCVVTGAGVLGVCLAARLAGAGAEVTLLEQDQPGHAATRSSFAWLNSNDKAPRAYHDLNVTGIEAWEELAATLGGAAWYRPVGNLEWAAGLSGHTELAARVRRLAGWRYPARLISAAEARGLEPSLRLPGTVTEVAWFPGEGYLLTEAMVGHLLDHLAAQGVRVLTGEPGRVTGFEVPDTGRGWGVRTAAGQLLPADVVVCCAGIQVPRLARLAGAAGPIPLVPWAEPGAAAPGLVVQAGPVAPPGPTRVVHAPQVYLRPHTGALVHLEAPDAAVDLHTPGEDLRRWAGELLDRARQVTRGLDGASVTGYRVCIRPMPADGRSIVGWLPGVEGVYVAVTHSGVTLGAYLAGLITAEVLGGTVAAGLAPFRPGRFTAGSPQPPAR
jgi:glycine/D-amino acid oxidase-like deaminating enzyme